MNGSLKEFARGNFPNSKADLFAMFLESGFERCKTTGFNSMVTMQSWMFLSSFESMRDKLLLNRTINTFVQVGYNSFPEINSKVAQACMFSILSKHICGFSGRYIDLNSAPQSSNKDEVFRSRSLENEHDVRQDDFFKIPGYPIAYWASDKLRSSFLAENNINSISPPRIGMMTNDNERFLRSWYEISYKDIGFGINSIEDAKKSSYKWFPYNKGGGFRKWAGFQSLIVNWQNGGEEISLSGMTSFRGKEFYFKKGITWSGISTGDFSCRYSDSGSMFDIQGTSSFPSELNIGVVASVLNSKVGAYILKLLNPTISYQSGDIRRVPLPDGVLSNRALFNANLKSLVDISRTDWDSFEISWGFQSIDFVSGMNCRRLLEESWRESARNRVQQIAITKQIEDQNNRLLIDAYGLQDELTSGVPEDQITLARADPEKDSQRLISYAIGCMMGRYSLDEPGLIYARAGNVGFDITLFKSFPADADGIVPITDELWFEDDATNRVREFLNVVWGAETLEENMDWLAESLGKKGTETPDETIRRYLSGSFYKDHLQTYKKRPIYWHFSSGKQGAFQALVYLHRYHEGTLARMRAEYVVPLTGKMQSRIEMLEKDRDAASATAARTKIAKQIESLKKKHVELLAYDEKLRHYADMRIQLDLDDGVKVNYGKFGELLDNVKAVTGGTEE